MEIKAILNKPCTEEQKYNFLDTYGGGYDNNYNYIIEETDNALEAWGYTSQELEEQENIRIANLHLTRGDVFRGLLLAKGVTRADIRAKIELMPEDTPQDKIEKEMALIDFEEALEFYRGVPLINTIGSQLGISAEQLNRFFDTNDWHELNN